MHRRIAREASNELILPHAAIVGVREESSPGGETDVLHELEGARSQKRFASELATSRRSDRKRKNGFDFSGRHALRNG